MSLSPLVYGQVVGRYVAIVADTPADPDLEPDVVPMSGRITLTPLPSRLLVATAQPAPVTVVPVSISAVLDDQGYLSLSGNRGVYVIATNDPATNPTSFSYRVTFELTLNGVKVPMPSFDVMVPAGAVVDLTTVAPVPPSVGEGLAAWQLAVQEALASQAAAEAAAAQSVAAAALAGDRAEEAVDVANASIVDAVLSNYNLTFIPKVGDPIPVGNVRGPIGPAGADGANVLPTDTAIAAAASAEATETFKSIDKTWVGKAELAPVTTGIVGGWLKHPMVGRGHSFIQGTGLSAPEYWAALFAAAAGKPYSNYGKGSSTAEDAAWRMWGTTSQGHVVGSQVDTTVHALLNSLGLNGIDAPTWRGVNYSLRTMVALASAKALYSAENTRFTYSAAGWGAVSTSGNYPGGKFRASSTGAAGIGAYVEFTTTTPAKGTYLLGLARRAGLTPGRTEIRRMDTNAVIFDWDNKDNAAAQLPAQIGAWNYAPAALPIDVPLGTLVRVTNLSPDGTAVGSTAICGLLEMDPDTTNRLFMMKEPKLANYTTSTLFPNRSDAAIDYFNTIIDTLAAEFPNVIAITPEPWWTKANAASLVQDDNVHPNAEGNRRLAEAAITAVARRAVRGLWDDIAAPAPVGWTDLSSFIAPGFTGTLQGRRIGDTIYLSGSLNATAPTTIPTATQTQLVAGLSTAWIPGAAGAVGAAYFSAPNADPGIIRVAATGNVNAIQSSGVGKGTCIFSVAYPAA